MTWTSDELDAVGTAEELNLASVRRDGTLRSRRYPTIVPSIVAPQARAATLRLVPR
jgi:hypothetical protein